jgi:hypothetical protein
MFDQPLLFLLEGHDEGGAGIFGFGPAEHRPVGFLATSRAEQYQELRLRQPEQFIWRRLLTRARMVDWPG